MGLTGASSKARKSRQAITAAAQQQAAAQVEAARIAAEQQQKGLDYLVESERLPRQYRESALSGLAGAYGLDGGAGGQQQFIEQAMASPLYQSLIGGREAGEEAILRSAGATGGLRSGNVQQNLYDYNTQLQNQALLQSYNQQIQGLQGLAGIGSYAPQIAGMYGDVGKTLASGIAGSAGTTAQGQIAAEQYRQQAAQQQAGNLMGIGQLGIGLGGLIGGGAGTALGALGGIAGLAGMFSDRRLKNNIKKLCKINGHNWYSWSWNSVANKLGLYGNTQGCMADEVYRKNKDAIVIKDNFLLVLYNNIGIFPTKGVSCG